MSVCRNLFYFSPLLSNLSHSHFLTLSPPFSFFLCLSLSTCFQLFLSTPVLCCNLCIERITNSLSAVVLPSRYCPRLISNRWPQCMYPVLLYRKKVPERIVERCVIDDRPIEPRDVRDVRKTWKDARRRQPNREETPLGAIAPIARVAD